MNYLDPAVGIVILANALALFVVVFGRRSGNVWRGSIALACAVAVVTYLIWRGSYLIDPQGLTSMEGILSRGVFIFEFLNFCDFFVFLATMSRLRNRSSEADRAQAELERVPPEDVPTVDVFVATYNEDWEILEKTIVAIKALRYPAGKVKGYLLDDGKRDWLKERCARENFGYIRRSGNAHKKPGNHNYALSETSGEFIAVFDADFIPMPDFLMRTIGLIASHPKWGILQTPQTFYNCDPMRNNLRLQNALPDDTAMFFTVMEPCRDSWGCSFYVGSSAVIRRKAAEAIGGVVMGYDTEDQITSIAMLQSGFETGFLNETLSTGLAPESLKALFEQRKRWARGSVQILFSKHGPFGPNLTPLQRIMFCQSFWLIGFIAPIFYAMLPAIMWIFHVRLFPNMPPEEVFWLPVFLFSTINLTIWWLSHGLWYPLVSQALQLLLSFEVLPTVLTTLIKPFGEPLLKFNHVTPKGKLAQTTSRINWTVLPWLLGILGATVVGIVAFLADDYQFIGHPDELKSAYLWTFVSSAIVFLGVLGCVSPVYKRSDERFPIRVPIRVTLAGVEFPSETTDLSMGGCKLVEPCPLNRGERVSIYLADIGETAAEVVRVDGNGVSARFLDLPKHTETALFCRIFLDPRNHRRKLDGAARLYTECLRRVIPGFRIGPLA